MLSSQFRVGGKELQEERVERRRLLSLRSGCIELGLNYGELGKYVIRKLMVGHYSEEL